MTRGEVWTVTPPGEFGKPRPAVIWQATPFLAAHATVAICLITSELVEAPLFRILVEPSKTNGLRAISQVQVDKIMAVRRERLGRRVGILDEAIVMALSRSLMVFLGLPS